MQEQLVSILTSFLGEPKDATSENGLDFTCPICSSDGDSQKFAISISKNVFKCWKCSETHGTHGKLTTFIKEHAGVETLRLYNAEIKNIKASKEYEFSIANGGDELTEDSDNEVRFPPKTYDFKFDGNKYEEKALNYLNNRGFDEQIIRYRGLKYTGNNCPISIWRNRIIIPSYDKFNQLNYYTGRSFNNSIPKYYNYENSNRKDLIFGESLVNMESADIILTEGPVDSIVLPNSVALMGKSLNSDYYLFETLIKLSTQKIIIFLDNDATLDAKFICERLNNAGLCNRIYYIPTEEIRLIINKAKGLNLEKLDPGIIYEKFGFRGISWCLKQMIQYQCV